MAQFVTLEISDVIAQSARRIAARTGRQLEDVLTDWLERGIDDVEFEQLPDTDILALANSQLPASQQNELSGLLARSRENTLTPDEKTRLETLMRVYRRGLVRKAKATRVAVQRGLRPPLG
jgi:hypothetical protein